MGEPWPTGRPVRVALDAMGGDHAPAALVAGALDAVAPGGLEVVLAGDPAVLTPLLPEPAPAGVHVLAGDAGGAAGPVVGVPARGGHRSSVEIACDLVRDGQADALVSAGPTGAAVATAALGLRRAPGVLRPALAVPLPVVRPGGHPTVLVDAGAVPDATVEMLTQFAVLGACYAEARLGTAEPTVGLLNIGSEPGKGDRRARAAYAAIEQALERSPVRFHGNVEGGDLLAGTVDVVVTDGFTGNVALKVIESALGIGPDAQRADVDGAAALVGLEATVLVAHGAARATGIASACRLAAELVRRGVTDTVGRRLAELA